MSVPGNNEATVRRVLLHLAAAETAADVPDLDETADALDALDALVGRVEQLENALSDPSEVARLFHEAYERLAPSFGYETRPDSAVPWDDVPATNKALMVAVAGEVCAALAGGSAATEPTP